MNATIPALPAHTDPETRSPGSPEMMAAPLLSIVTVCLNADATIAETLQSIDTLADLAIAEGAFEHLVVDGMSTDATRSLVDGHPAPYRRTVTMRDSGIYNAMNNGLALARGEYVWFVNSDDLLAPEASRWFPDLLQLLRAARPDIVAGEISMFRDLGDHRQTTRVWPLPSNLDKARAWGWHPPHPAFIARRDLLAKLHGFDERKKIAADFKLMLASLQAGAGKVERFPRTMVHMREGGASTQSWRAVLRANIECHRSLRELGVGAPKATGLIALKLARKVLQKFHRPRA